MVTFLQNNAGIKHQIMDDEEAPAEKMCAGESIVERVLAVCAKLGGKVVVVEALTH